MDWSGLKGRRGYKRRRVLTRQKAFPWAFSTASLQRFPHASQRNGLHDDGSMASRKSCPLTLAEMVDC